MTQELKAPLQDELSRIINTLEESADYPREERLQTLKSLAKESLYFFYAIKGYRKSLGVIYDREFAKVEEEFIELSQEDCLGFSELHDKLCKNFPRARALAGINQSVYFLSYLDYFKSFEYLEQFGEIGDSNEDVGFHPYAFASQHCFPHKPPHDMNWSFTPDEQKKLANILRERLSEYTHKTVGKTGPKECNSILESIGIEALERGRTIIEALYKIYKAHDQACSS